MATFEAGDLVVLKSGSMRMIVERVEGDSVAVIWANEGVIGRDMLPMFVLNKWEHREEHRPAPRGDRPFQPRGDRPFSPRPPRGDDEERPFRPRFRRDDEGGGEGGGDDARPARPWAGKPGGGKPFGAKPGGGKPFGAKPYGGKPGGFGGGRPGMDGKPRPKNFYRKDE